MTQDPTKLPGEDDVRAWLNHSPPSFYRTRITTRYQELRADASRDPEAVSTFFTGETEAILGCLVAILKTGESPAPPQALTDACLVKANGNFAPKPRLPGHKIMKLVREESLERFLLLVCATPDKEPYFGEPEGERLRRLEGAFHQPYRGNAHDWLGDAIRVYEKQYNPDQHYGHVIPILQSSGAGKSRLVEELGYTYPTLSVCLREDSGPSSGWPPPDIPVVEYFQEREYYGEELAAAFLGALMERVAETMPADSDPPPRAKELMADWALSSNGTSQSSSREAHLQHVKDDATFLLTHNITILQRKRRWMKPSPRSSAAAVSADAQAAPESSDPLQSSITWHKDLFDLFCAERYAHLKVALANHGHRRFFLAFDECVTLGQPSKDRSPMKGMSLIALQRILKAGEGSSNVAGNKDDFTVWYLLLDTSSHFAQLAPYGPNAASHRLTKNLRPLHPWIYLGFNQVVKDLIKNSNHVLSTPGAALEVKFLKRYGRPYWSTLTDEEVIRAAYQKLFDVGHVDQSGFDSQKVHHVFAAFSHRVTLEIGQNEASMRIAAEAVSRHMRILTAIVNDILVTEAPSEPALALASARALNVSPEVYREAFNTLLVRLAQQGIVMDRGHQGELCSLLLLMLARDMAAHNRGGFFDDMRNPQRVRAITQWDFLSTLLGTRIEALAGAPGLKEFGAERWINFTHVIQLEECFDQIPLTLLRDAWQVGAMLRCAHNQPVIDGFWPEYVGSLDEPTKLENFCYGAYQSKARANAASSALVSQLVGPFLVDDSPSVSKPRFKPKHVVLLMDLGTDAVISQTQKLLDIQFKPASPPDAGPKTWKGYAHSSGEMEPSRYCINIRGHAAAQYPVIDRFSEFEKTVDQLFNASLFTGNAGLTIYQERTHVLLDPLKLASDAFDMEDLNAAVPDS